MKIEAEKLYLTGMKGINAFAFEKSPLSPSSLFMVFSVAVQVAAVVLPC
jgi:hypothetical protein